ncbi:MAG: hypothetical protein JXB18_12025 [Sedimentisphaerales bacterium]|nr:hypothetical protein [Sedimentisphaerales bacterium]
MKNGFYQATLVGLLVLTVGCAGERKQLAQPTCFDAVSTEKLMQVSEKALLDMQFRIQKFDVDNGIIRTHPLRAKQFFEFWRKDNAGAYNSAEANLQSLQRSVELVFRTEQNRVCIECITLVQRLSLPEETIRGYNTAPALYTASDRSKQRLEVEPERLEQMQWIDLGRDEALEYKVITQIQKFLEKELHS